MISQGWYKSQRDDYDHDLCHDYGNDCDLDHMQYDYMSKGVDRDDAYDNDDKKDDNGDAHIDHIDP